MSSEKTQAIRKEASTITVTAEKIAELQACTYSFAYKDKYKCNSGQILAANYEDACRITKEYCAKYKYRWLSVHPFFMDLDKAPPETRAGL